MRPLTADDVPRSRVHEQVRARRNTGDDTLSHRNAYAYVCDGAV